MSVKTFIYGLFSKDDPDHIRYVGKTIHIKKRASQHQKQASDGSTWPVHNWIRKHGQIELKVLDVLEDATDEEWGLAEQTHIDTLKLEGHELLNLMPGGVGSPTIGKSGGSRPGESHPEAILTDKIVKKCRKLSKKGLTYIEIIKELDLNVHVSTVAMAVTGVTWSHLPGADNQDRSENSFNRTGVKNNRAQLDNSLVIRSRSLAREGYSNPEILKMLDLKVSRRGINQAIRGTTWKHLNDIAPPVKGRRKKK